MALHQPIRQLTGLLERGKGIVELRSAFSARGKYFTVKVKEKFLLLMCFCFT